MSSGIRSSRKEEVLERDDGQEHSQEWLDLRLGLGIGPGPACPRAEPAPGPGPSGVRLADEDVGELGLRLGLGDDGVRKHGDDHGHGQLQQEQGSSTASLTPPPLHQPSSSSGHVHLAGSLDRQNAHPVDSWARPDGPRPGAGIWFSLRAACSLNGEGDALPQIPKAYIRVKDEKATVSMVKTYLVRKLGFTDESEIEITCMGQKLEQSQTLKDVRDSVWSPRVFAQSLNESSLGTDVDKFAPIDNCMSLYYQRPGQPSLD